MILSCEQNDSEDKRCNQQFEEWTDRDGFGCDFYSGKSHLKRLFKVKKIEFTAVLRKQKRPFANARKLIIYCVNR